MQINDHSILIMSGGLKGPWTAEEEYFRDQLTMMSKLPENSECADCTSKAPRWAVFNHGVFVCIKCSGQHRNLGAGISKVRSINLDRWKPEQFEQMVGNEAANAELLYNMPQGIKKPAEDDDYGRQKWIQTKYVQRKYVRRDDQEPVDVEKMQTSKVTAQKQKAVRAIPIPIHGVYKPMAMAGAFPPPAFPPPSNQLPQQVIKKAQSPQMQPVIQIKRAQSLSRPTQMSAPAFVPVPIKEQYQAPPEQESLLQFREEVKIQPMQPALTQREVTDMQKLYVQTVIQSAVLFGDILAMYDKPIIQMEEQAKPEQTGFDINSIFADIQQHTNEEIDAKQ